MEEIRNQEDLDEINRLAQELQCNSDPPLLNYEERHYYSNDYGNNYQQPTLEHQLQACVNQADQEHFSRNQEDQPPAQLEFQPTRKIVEILGYMSRASNTKYRCKLDDDSIILLTAAEIGDDLALRAFRKKTRATINRRAYIKKRDSLKTV